MLQSSETLLFSIRNIHVYYNLKCVTAEDFSKLFAQKHLVLWMSAITRFWRNLTKDVTYVALKNT